MYYKNCLILALSLILLMPAALAESEPVQITVVAEEFWPYSFATDASEEPQGILIDFAIELLDAAGLDYELRLLPWPRVMKRVHEQDNQLLVAFVRTREREEQVHWIGPVAEVNHAMYGVESNEPRPTSLAEIETRIVATVVDDVASDYLEQKGFTNLVRTSDHLKGLEMLTRGRVELYPGNRALIQFQCAKLPDGCGNIRLEIPLEELEQELYFALSPTTDTATVELLRQNFERLVADGRIAAIRQSFLDSQANPGAGE